LGNLPSKNDLFTYFFGCRPSLNGDSETVPKPAVETKMGFKIANFRDNHQESPSWTLSICKGTLCLISKQFCNDPSCVAMPAF